MTRYRINGMLLELRSNDLDGDGESGNGVTEFLNPNIGTQPIVQSTEMGESLRELNEDSLDETTRMSSIDMRSRLHWLQIPAMATFDSLISMRFLPTRCSTITRQLKRLAVSAGGAGREEMVKIISGNRQHEENKGNGGMFGGIKDWMGGKK